MITQDEKTTLSWLISESKDNLIHLRPQLLTERWSEESRPFVQAIIDFSESKDTGTAKDWVMNCTYNTALFIEIVRLFASSTIGKKQFAKLLHAQQETFLRSELKKLDTIDADALPDAIIKIAQNKNTTFKPRSLLEASVERIAEKKLEALAPSTGYRDLDTYIVGFIPGHLYTLSGLTNAGKSTICLNFVARASMQDKKCLYFALEPENTIVDYLASIRLNKKFKDLTEADITYDDPNIQMFGKDGVRKIDDLVTAVRSLPRYDLIVIDHIGYFTSDGSNTVQKQSDVLLKLAGLAKERQSAIIIIQHLNKSKQNTDNPEDNIKGSSSFKQDSTDVLIITRDTEEAEFGAPTLLNTGTIMIRKSKSERPQGTIRINFVPGTALILDSHDQAGFF